MGTLPKGVQTIFKCYPQILGTRQSHYFHIDICKTQLVESSNRFKGVKLWNALVCNFEMPRSIHVFKKKN